jgi:hypothetical protein
MISKPLHPDDSVMAEFRSGLSRWSRVPPAAQNGLMSLDSDTRPKPVLLTIVLLTIVLLTIVLLTIISTVPQP